MLIRDLYLCILHGYNLRFDGLDSAPGGFRAVFRVDYQHSGRTVTEGFRSRRVHVEMRNAQNDAASEALLRLQLLRK